MPNKWPTISGNWSNNAIWNGGTKPVAGDDVFANNLSVYIDEPTVTVATLRNSSGTGITAGGIFYINDGVNINLTGNPAMYHTGPIVYAATNTPLVIISGSNSATLTGSLGSTTFGPKIHLQGNASLRISGSVASTTNTANIGIRHSSTGNLTITGSLTPGGGGSAHVIYIDGSGSMNLSGSVVGAGIAIGIYNISSGIVRIVGNVNGPTGTNGATSVYNLTTGTIIVTGSVSGGDANYNGKWGIYNAGSGNIYISGSVLAGNGGQQANGVANASIGLVEIIGTVVGGGAAFGGPLTSMAGAQNNGNGTLIIIGPISASIISPGVNATGTTATNIFTGPFYNTGSFNAVYAYRMQVFNQPTRWTFDTDVPGTQKTLTTIDAMPGVPSGSNVRRGVAYGFVGNLTGSLNMPSPVSVKQGEPVDNTTGTAIISPQDIFNALTQNITTTGSIGELLTRASTVQTAGATISTFRI